MEWYSGQTQYNTANYAYAAPPQHVSTAYNSGFEDEPPLLEGGSQSAVLSAPHLSALATSVRDFNKCGSSIPKWIHYKPHDQSRSGQPLQRMCVAC